MELRHLRYFVAVAEAGSVTKAAARLNMQQPPLSQQIRALEDELGVQLFDRMAKRVVLNPAGKQFLEDARRTLDSAAAAVARVRRFDRGEQGHVATGFTSSASLHHLAPRLIRAFRAAYPLATLDVEERETFELLSAVDEKRLDVAFVRTTGARFTSLESHTLDEEAVVAAIPADHALALSTKPVPLGVLMRERLVLYRRPDGVGIFDVLMEAIRRAGFTPAVADEVPRIIAALNLVAAGQGVSLVPASMRAVHTESVVYRPLVAKSLPPMKLVLVHRRDDATTLVRNFITVALQAAG